MNNYSVKKKIYLFDFDGTVAYGDSFIKFTYFSLNFINFLRYWISVLFKYPFDSNSAIKEMFFSYFKGYDFYEFNSLCSDFMECYISKSIKVSFINFVKKIDNNSKIVIVSASVSNYLKPWCDKMEFDLISTELEVINGKLTGRFSTLNCNEEEKVRRINIRINLYEYDEIHVFGDSKGDKPMLNLGTHKYYKFFE